MSVVDPEAAQVALDRAMSVGLMGYPPILGKRVVILAIGPAAAWEGTVTDMGPLGFVVLDDAKRRRFFPWTVTVVWDDAL